MSLTLQGSGPQQMVLAKQATLIRTRKAALSLTCTQSLRGCQMASFNNMYLKETRASLPVSDQGHKRFI